MGRINTSLKASINYRCGSSGSGKSAGVKIDLARLKPSRLAIFDPDGEYEYDPNDPHRHDYFKNVVTVTTITELIDWLKRYPKGALKIRLVANGPKKFDMFCKAVFMWAKCTVVAEEIAGVTTPTKAPDGWHTLVSRGRKYGVTLYAVTQRPAEADKTVLGNATEIRTGRLSRAKDRKYLAEEMDLHPNQLVMQNLEYVACDMSTLRTEKARIGSRKRPEVIRQ